MIVANDVNEDLPLDHSRQLALAVLSMVSIMYLCASRASSDLPAERKAWHRFWCVVSNRVSRTQPKSWMKFYVMKSIMYA
jgi:hypothetical protein